MQRFSSNTLSRFKITANQPLWRSSSSAASLLWLRQSSLKYFGKVQPREARPCRGCGRWVLHCVMRSDLNWCVFLHLQLNKWYCEDLTVHVCDDPLLHKDLFVCILTQRTLRYTLLTAVKEQEQNCWRRCWTKSCQKGCSFFSGKK